jgi:3-vinyl bacteriochlorophyllide hydratase
MNKTLLYTKEERERRDKSRWTIVQGVLAPIQFLVFLVSVSLIARYFFTGDGFAVASASVVIKTVVLYLIMATGAIWEKDVFGVYLFARPFFWEDVVSVLVITLHTAYLLASHTETLGPRELMWLALVAYASYIINAGQFLLKLRAARLSNSKAAADAARLAPGITA